ncbi:hypothetical protein ACFQHV_00355 [Promicromonospora thailandica]|uniref:Uncharacterized protein n=1 Tax=Promicromonospora thailandica TaxID=765201 RepID=A0A9X2G3U6_9MICO|nr:hypothetical protein [Promicromonospora thailandica]MCP2262809.1 hypothetical protein [Promicromonospora thailandica]
MASEISIQGSILLISGGYGHDQGVEAGSPLAVVALTVFGTAIIYAVYATLRSWIDERWTDVLVSRMKNGIGRGDLELSRGHVRALPVICVIGANTVLDGFALTFFTDPRWSTS